MLKARLEVNMQVLDSSTPSTSMATPSRIRKPVAGTHPKKKIKIKIRKNKPQLHFQSRDRKPQVSNKSPSNFEHRVSATRISHIDSTHIRLPPH
jgi:hypothetical protein